jgi:uncharacterized Zn finger protein (UPF0148 family)
MTVSDKDRAIASMGDLLLKGWCMTNEGCENCSMPLMRSKTGEEVCTQCALRPQQPSVTPCLDQESPVLPPKKESPIPTKDSNKESLTDKASRLIGQKLLQGFTMLDRTCDDCTGVPLVGDRKSGTASCVLCRKSVTWPQVPDRVSSNALKEDAIKQESKEVKTGMEEKSMVPQKRALSPDSLTKPIDTEYSLTLKEKINQLMKELNKTSDALLIKHFADAIKSCADALKSLEKI